MSGKGSAEGVTGEMVLPAEAFFIVLEMIADVGAVNMSGSAFLLGEKPAVAVYVDVSFDGLT